MSFAFDSMHVHHLTRNMRMEAVGAGSAAGQDLLLNFGEGMTGDRVKIPEDLLLDYEDEKAMLKALLSRLFN
jgi:hypothetical protein